VILGLDIGRSISEAIEAPRVHSQLLPPRVDSDSSFDDSLLEGLRERGHNVTITDVDSVKAVVQGIVVRDGVLWGELGHILYCIGDLTPWHAAAADSRKNGIAAGY